ncbi:MAG: hypothetical protein WCK32_00825 [Chlorobiaceae bacterium]
MSFDLRMKRKGQLHTMQENRRKIVTEAGNALTILQMKADPYAELESLDTKAIRQAADDLDLAVVEIRKLTASINEINIELYG